MSSARREPQSGKWTCPTCLRLRQTAYCSRCGEQPLRPRDLTVVDLMTQFTKSLTSVDGRLIRSFRALILSPGSLTAAHIRGERRRYLAPLPTFLVANALFFAIQSLTRTNVLSSPLQSHLQIQDWSPLAQDLVASELASRGLTLAEFAIRFNIGALFYAKTLIILMALAFSTILPLAFYAKHKKFGVHIVFATHLYAFVLLLFCGSLLVAEANLLAGGKGLDSPLVDTLLTIANLAICWAYLHAAIGAVYDARGVARMVKAFLLAVAVTAIVVGYRFVIFLITLYSI